MTKLLRVFAVVAFALSLLSGFSVAKATTTYYPLFDYATDDVIVVQDDPNTSYGSDGVITTYGLSSHQKWGIVEFDVTPPDANGGEEMVLIEAKVYLTVADTTDNMPTCSFTSPVDFDVIESSGTVWGNRPSIGSVIDDIGNASPAVGYEVLCQPEATIGEDLYGKTTATVIVKGGSSTDPFGFYSSEDSSYKPRLQQVWVLPSEYCAFGEGHDTTWVCNL